MTELNRLRKLGERYSFHAWIWFGNLLEVYMVYFHRNRPCSHIYLRNDCLRAFENRRRRILSTGSHGYVNLVWISHYLIIMSRLVTQLPDGFWLPLLSCKYLSGDPMLFTIRMNLHCKRYFHQNYINCYRVSMLRSWSVEIPKESPTFWWMGSERSWNQTRMARLLHSAGAI